MKKKAGGAADIYILDDHPIVRDAMADLLAAHPGWKIVGTSNSASQTWKDLSRLKIDLLVLDLAVGLGLEGFELIGRAHKHYPELLILVHSMYSEDQFARRCLKAGAHGYVEKSSESDALLNAAERVLAGQIAISPKLQNELVSLFLGRGDRVEDPMDDLTDREMEVFQLIGVGLGTEEISREMGISKSTVESHRGKIKEKLRIDTNSQLVRTAVEWELRMHGGLPVQE